MVRLYKGRCLHNYMDVPETSVSMFVHLSGFKKFVINYFNEIFDTVLCLWSVTYLSFLLLCTKWCLNAVKIGKSGACTTTIWYDLSTIPSHTGLYCDLSTATGKELLVPYCSQKFLC